MRPVRLTMQAFGPYPGREVVDFRRAVEAGLFGIYGPTGSGKSTIFSAMTFALFGEPTKIDQDAPSLRSDHADAGIQTEVEFVFDIGERRFVILRRPEQMRLKQRGAGETRSPHEVYLFDATGLALDQIQEGERGKIIAERKVGVVDAAISEMLGYGPEQFRQIVLLPQGRFEKFLEAKTKDRLEILRELFDVSVFRRLTEKLKADAEAAERDISDERALCARRRASEGFESTDALLAGIAEADAAHVEQLGLEQAARKSFESAQSTLREAEKLDTQFKAAEDAQESLATLLAGEDSINALADQVSRADRARSLVDIEAHVTETAGEVRSSEELLEKTREAADVAETMANSAAKALKEEIDRVAETEGLRQQVEELDRHKGTLEKSADIAQEVEKARTVEREAARSFEDAQRQLTGLKNKHQEEAEALKVSRQVEGRRQEIATHLTALKSALGVASTFESADKDVVAAKTAVDDLNAQHEIAARNAEEARVKFEHAERSLSVAQALHLATKLEKDEPCPVCGSTDHPSPATGATEHAGLDKAFREARAAWQQAEQAAHDSLQQLTAAQSIQKERQDRFATLDRPKDGADALKQEVRTAQQAFDDLGPQIDIAKAEMEVEELGAQIASLEKERDASREAYSKCQSETTTAKVRLDEILSVVPEPLRDPSTLAATRATAWQSLTDRQAAKATAEKKSTETREASLAAQKDLQAADKEHVNCKQRHRKAADGFEARLKEAGLSEDDFRSLKPAIATIEADRSTVEEHRRRLANAKETAKKLAEAVQELVRPDLEAIGAEVVAADKKLTEGINQRSDAWHRLDRLTKLQNELAETSRKLDEAEAATAPLRKLAALMNGSNSQKLDLETYAIGAMFDQILEAANLRLAPMSGNRFRLERDLEVAGRGRQGLGILAFDYFTGKARPTTTLSGGETFVAALALALGLADIVESASGKVRLDTIFIDEGFGSLDTENGAGTLDQVLEALSSVVRQNRAVGLISHVQLVQEVIPNGFYVRKNLSGSTIETRSGV